MSDVQRYDCEGHDYMIVEYASGEFVAYDDYEELSDEHEVLKRKYNRLVENITALWRDA